MRLPMSATAPSNDAGPQPRAAIVRLARERGQRGSGHGETEFDARIVVERAGMVVPADQRADADHAGRARRRTARPGCGRRPYMARGERGGGGVVRLARRVSSLVLRDQLLARVRCRGAAVACVAGRFARRRRRRVAALLFGVHQQLPGAGPRSPLSNASRVTTSLLVLAVIATDSLVCAVPSALSISSRHGCAGDPHRGHRGRRCSFRFARQWLRRRRRGGRWRRGSGQGGGSASTSGPGGIPDSAVAARPAHVPSGPAGRSTAGKRVRYPAHCPLRDAASRLPFRPPCGATPCIHDSIRHHRPHPVVRLQRTPRRTGASTPRWNRSTRRFGWDRPPSPSSPTPSARPARLPGDTIISHLRQHRRRAGDGPVRAATSLVAVMADLFSIERRS